MTNSPGSEASHDSGDENNDTSQNPKAPAIKDKECQYCQQKFTSSSLGRHLDQFISKKKPDGVHDVDEIRRLRGGITRRTARNNHRKDQDDAHSAQHSPSPQYTLPSYSELLNKTTTAPNELRFNRMNWQATGVITDPPSLNPPVAGIASPAISNTPATGTSGTKRNFSTYASDLPALNPVVSETTRALELSLREVLDAVRTASKKASPSQKAFPFDFTAQTFPYLCLALLQPPATLFTSAPFATSSSIPLSPPGIEQYQALRKTVDYNIDQWKWARLGYLQRTSSSPNFAEEIDDVNDYAAAQSQSASQHLDAAYQNFMSLSQDLRQHLWTVELLRSFKTEQDKLKMAKTEIERLSQETVQLQQQIDHLSKCQWPREMALWPPDRVTLDEKTRDELGRINLVKGELIDSIDGNNEGSPDEQQRGGCDRWDYDLLVNKWKRHVREDRSRRNGIQPAMPILHSAGPPPPDNQLSALSDHSTASTPRLQSGLAKSSVVDYRSNSLGQPVDGTNIHNSHLMNGTNSNVSGASTSLEPRRKFFPVVSDVDDIFTPRMRGLRADNMMKSATP